MNRRVYPLFFFQAEDGIRDATVTGVQTCALPIFAPGGLVAGDARVQHEVVVPAGDRDRVELDRPELPEDLEHPVEASRERPRGREEVPRDEKATRHLSSDHLEDTSCARVYRG